MNKPKTLRVAHVLAGAPVGGAENFYTRLIAALADRPELVQHAFTRPNARRESILHEAKVPVTTFRFGGPLHIIDHWRYRRALKQWKPDIVVTYMGRATKLTPRGPYKLVARLGHYYDLKTYQHCDHWIGVSKGISQYMLENGIPGDRIKYIPNFVDESIPAPLERTSFDTPKDQPIIFALGRLHKNKAFDVLLNAFSQVKTGTLWLAGEGPEKNNLIDQTEALGLTDRVRFLGWRNDVNALMQTADLFVCPSRHEGLGSIIGEAWINKCPMVATRSQGPAELIKDGITGLLTPIDEVKPLTAAINYCLENPEKAKELADHGYTQYLENFSKSKICQEYIDFFNEIHID